jgi:hypothetical protein
MYNRAQECSGLDLHGCMECGDMSINKKGMADALNNVM